MEKTKEELLFACLKDIDVHAKKLLVDYKNHQDDFAYLRDILSPDGNNACIKLGRLRRSLLAFAPGTIQDVWLTEWHSASMRLLDDIKRDHPEIISLHHAWNAPVRFGGAFAHVRS